MANPKPTQELTQPVARRTLRKSMYGIPDAEDIICVLKPNSEAAIKIVQNAARETPQHVLFESEVDVNSEDEVQTDDGEDYPKRPPRPRRPLSLALRISSKVRDLAMGFVFGRDGTRSDIVFKTGLEDTRVSSRHFRVFFNDALILMVEDHSTNGTHVDHQLLTYKDPPNSKRPFTEGTSISVAVYGDRSTRTIVYATFTVFLPERDGELYSKNLQGYIQRVREAKSAKLTPGEAPANFGFMPTSLVIASTQKFHHGMHWNGSPNYRVLGKIGSGAFATVYKIANLDGEPFAAKEVDMKKVVKDGIFGNNLNNELSIVKKLSHPNIVKFCDWKEVGNWLYIIMEFVPCGDLSKYTSSETNLLPQGNVKQVAHQICQALNHIHSQCITHRDIKPENILIANTNPLTVKLTDFGLSKVVRTDDLTMLKTFCGTLLYCAPEVYPEFERLRSGAPRLRQRPPRSSPYSSAVDIWSFGAVLYQLLTTRPPIKGAKDGVEMLDAILNGQIDFACLVRAGLEKDGLDFLTKMLAVDACDRINAEACLFHPWLMDLNKEKPLLALRPSVTLAETHKTDAGKVTDEYDVQPVQENLFAAIPGKTQAFTQIGSPTQREKTLTTTARAKEAGPKPRFETRLSAEKILTADPRGDQSVLKTAGASESFTHAAAGLIDSERGGSISGSASTKPVSKHPLVNSLDEDESPSQWSPREPRVHAGSSDSDEVLPDVEEFANDIAAGTSQERGADDPSTGASSLMDLGNYVPSSHEIPDSVSGTSEVDRSMIADLEPDQARALRHQHESQGTTGRLFGELTSSGLGESGIFGRESRPIIRQNGIRPRTSSLHGAEEQMDILQVSPPQERGEAGLDRAPFTPLPKRVLDLSDDQDAAAKASKRSMTRNHRPPLSQSVSFAAQTTVNGRRLLGKLKPCPGSIVPGPVEIFKAVTGWGRHPGATHQWPDPNDRRIPQIGIEITFFRPGLWDPFGGLSWEQLDAELRESDALITTLYQSGIRINGVRLRSRKGMVDATPCGILRSGDIIDVSNSDDGSLRFECEFYVSRSAAIRTDDEPFLIEESTGLADLLAGRRAQREEAALAAGAAAAAPGGGGVGGGENGVTPAVG